ncbi:MAG TPA: zinc-ribbon domain-containing protein, partial [Myxococcota bacterium]|nr:zinc-ribbon domain-containing protein [Myxococcota bacterium]
MQVTCPHCGARYQFERSLIPQAGYDAQCANCSGIFVVAPDASGNEAPIALPSMSMIDTWLAPPALAPKSARTVASQATASRAATGVGTAPMVTDVTPRQKPRAGRDGPATVTVLPVGGRGGLSTNAGLAEATELQFSIACPACETVYAFAANDIPRGGVEAPCTQCANPFRLTRVGDPDVVAELPPDSIEHDDDTIPAAVDLLRPLDAEVLDEESSEPEVGRVLATETGRASVMDPDEETTVDAPGSAATDARPSFGESIAEGPTASG